MTVKKKKKITSTKLKPEFDGPERQKIFLSFEALSSFGF